MNKNIMNQNGAEGKAADIDPRSPCPYLPGSEGKLRWLQARAAAHLPLFLPSDVAGRRGRRMLRRACLALGIA